MLTVGHCRQVAVWTRGEGFGEEVDQPLRAQDTLMVPKSLTTMAGVSPRTRGMEWKLAHSSKYSRGMGVEHMTSATVLLEM
jgi:hypothetical protein